MTHSPSSFRNHSSVQPVDILHSCICELPIDREQLKVPQESTALNSFYYHFELNFPRESLKFRSKEDLQLNGGEKKSWPFMIVACLLSVIVSKLYVRVRERRAREECRGAGEEGA